MSSDTRHPLRGLGSQSCQQQAPVIDTFIHNCGIIMAANPPLLRSTFGQNNLVPTPYPMEAICLSRQGILLNIDGVRTADGRQDASFPQLTDRHDKPGILIICARRRWSAKGIMYLTNMRIVFIADVQATGSGECVLYRQDK